MLDEQSAAFRGEAIIRGGDRVYVKFEYRSVEDRARSIAEGHPCFKDAAFVVITKPGSTYRHEAVYDDLPQDEKDRFKDGYAAWKRGDAVPLKGTDVRQWAAIMRGQAEELWANGVKTIEDLAGMPQHEVEKLGMGYANLQEKARAWLSAASSTGRIAEKVAAQQAQINDLIASTKAKDETIAKLLASVEAQQAITKAGKKAAA